MQHCGTTIKSHAVLLGVFPSAESWQAQECSELHQLMGAEEY